MKNADKFAIIGIALALYFAPILSSPPPLQDEIPDLETCGDGVRAKPKPLPFPASWYPPGKVPNINPCYVEAVEIDYELEQYKRQLQ